VVGDQADEPGHEDAAGVAECGQGAEHARAAGGVTIGGDGEHRGPEATAGEAGEDAGGEGERRDGQEAAEEEEDDGAAAAPGHELKGVEAGAGEADHHATEGHGDGEEEE